LSATSDKLPDSRSKTFGGLANANVTLPVSVLMTSELDVTSETTPRTIVEAFGADTSPADAAVESYRAFERPQATPHIEAASSAANDRVKY
jgi:hypothetical protein